jgi:predicted deacetylase
MFSKYIIRLDDACPTMNHKHWNRMENILDKYNINPMVAVIPNNKDKKLMVNAIKENFWKSVKLWQNKKWEIALHGFEHKYVSKSAGLVPINSYSEFSGLELEKQCYKIKEGIRIFKEHDINCRLWIAPAHSFDENTIKALKKESDITIISDGIAFSPYYEYDMYWIPQQLWKPREMLFGTWTICYHPEEMKEKDFVRLENFLEKNHQKVTSVEKLKLSKRKKNIIEKIFERAYWKMLRKKQAEDV